MRYISARYWTLKSHQKKNRMEVIYSTLVASRHECCLNEDEMKFIYIHYVSAFIGFMCVIFPPLYVFNLFSPLPVYLSLLLFRLFFTLIRGAYFIRLNAIYHRVIFSLFLFLFFVVHYRTHNYIDCFNCTVVQWTIVNSYLFHAYMRTTFLSFFRVIAFFVFHSVCSHLQFRSLPFGVLKFMIRCSQFTKCKSTFACAHLKFISNVFSKINRANEHFISMIWASPRAPRTFHTFWHTIHSLLLLFFFVCTFPLFFKFLHCIYVQ